MSISPGSPASATSNGSSSETSSAAADLAFSSPGPRVVRPSGNRKVRLAIITCDVPLPKTAARFGSYAGVFKSLLKTGAEVKDGGRGVTKKKKNEEEGVLVAGKETGEEEGDSSPARTTATATAHSSYDDLEITVWDAEGKGEFPDLEDVDAVLIPGSRYNSFDSTPWILDLVSFTRACLSTNRIRILGICFGHQILALALGTPTGRNPAGWEISTHTMKLSSTGQRLFPGHSELQLYQVHRDIVLELPAGVESLGFSTRCQVQGMYVPGQLLSLQGHPEFDRDLMVEIFETRHKIGAFDDELFEDALRRLENEEDGKTVVASRLLEFLVEGH